MTWQVQEAKNKLSEVIEKARTKGPQTITRHGHGVAVLLSLDEYQKLTRPKESLVEFFLRSPLRGSGLKIRRNRDTRVRKVDLGP